jgi:hypothetical protein
VRDGKTRELSEEDADEAEFAAMQRSDAGLEADFQLAVAATAAAGATRRGLRMMGAPWAFWVDVCSALGRTGRSHGTAAVLAVFIYRRTVVCRTRTVKLPGRDLAELGVDRWQRRRALAALVNAGLVRTEREGPGQSTRVTLLWRPPPRS